MSEEAHDSILVFPEFVTECRGDIAVKVEKLLRPNSITLSVSKLVRSWSQTYSELKFGLSASLLAAN